MTKTDLTTIGWLVLKLMVDFLVVIYLIWRLGNGKTNS
jgi:hypothetical protein